MSAIEYLRWEREQAEKHEYHLGEVFAMAGGSPRHNFLSAAVAAELRSALRERGCHVLSSDQRISNQQGQDYVYADAVAADGGLQLEEGTTDVRANPKIVGEVLSPSTEAYDRGAKWAAYQAVPSLTDYILVAQDSVRVEHFRREPDGSWRYLLAEEGGTLVLADGVPLPLNAVYAGAFELQAS